MMRLKLVHKDYISMILVSVSIMVAFCVGANSVQRPTFGQLKKPWGIPQRL